MLTAGGEPLSDALSKQSDIAWEIMHYERRRRDEHISKLRFGLVGFNSASLVAIATFGPTAMSLSPEVIIISSLFFLTGTIFAGVTIFNHQNYLIGTAGDAFAKANLLKNAADWSRSPHNVHNTTALDRALKEVKNAKEPGIDTDSRATWWLQSYAACSWLGGVVFVSYCAFEARLPGILAILRRSPIWPG